MLLGLETIFVKASGSNLIVVALYITLRGIQIEPGLLAMAWLAWGHEYRSCYLLSLQYSTGEQIKMWVILAAALVVALAYLISIALSMERESVRGRD